MIELNVAAHAIKRYDGYGRYIRQFIQAMLTSGDFDVHPLVVEQLDWDGWLQNAAGINHNRLTLSIMPSHELRNIPARQWNLSMYECELLPDGWADHVNTKAERLLAPCRWVADVFKNNGVEVPIHLIPGGVDFGECALLTPVRRGQRPYTFLALADRGNRKGWDTVISALSEYFRPDDDVALIVKARTTEILKQFPRAGIRDAMAQKVHFWVGDVPNVRDVFAYADCVVYPACADGFGMFPREAAACGLPAIVTNYSGTEDCEAWAYPLNNYVLAQSPLPTPEKGGKWAKPNYREVGERMRACYENQDCARQKGLQSAAWLRANQTWAHSAAALKALITEIDVTQPAALAAQWAEDEQLFTQDAERFGALIAEQRSAQEN